MLIHRGEGLRQFAKLRLATYFLLSECAGAEANDNFSRMIHSVAKNTGYFSGKSGNTGNNWLLGHDHSPFWVDSFNSETEHVVSHSLVNEC